MRMHSYDVSIARNVAHDVHSLTHACKVILDQSSSLSKLTANPEMQWFKTDPEFRAAWLTIDATKN